MSSKSAADQAKKLALAVKVGVRTSRCSCCRLAPSLRARLVESSKFMVFSTGSMRESHPILGSRSSPIKLFLSRVGAQCCGFGGLVVEVVGSP